MASRMPLAIEHRALPPPVIGLMVEHGTTVPSAPVTVQSTVPVIFVLPTMAGVIADPNEMALPEVMVVKVGVTVSVVFVVPSANAGTAASVEAASTPQDRTAATAVPRRIRFTYPIPSYRQNRPVGRGSHQALPRLLPIIANPAGRVNYPP